MVEIMLGDTMPWFFPALALLLCLWLFIGSIEKMPVVPGSVSTNLASLLLRLTPPVMLAWLFLNRVVAIMLNDASHMEVLQFLPDGATFTERCTLLFAGQGGLELAALTAVVFVVFSHRLPSVQALGIHAAIAVRQRMMMYCAFCLLLGAGVFFPEHAYTASNPLPAQTIGAIPAISNALLPVLFALMLMFGGELFAASTVYNVDVDFSTIARKASIKCIVVVASALIWLSTGPQAWEVWVQDPTASTHVVALLMLLHATVVLTAVLQPSRRIETRLLHGEQRSIALLVTFGTVALIMLIATSLLLRTEPVFETFAGSNLYAVWLCTAVLSAMLLVQFMPTLGFDAAPRPETWWLRAMGLVMPMIVMAVTPLAAYLIPGVWLALCWSLVVPWIIESDVQSPSLNFVIIPLILATLAGLGLPLLASHALIGALFACLPALLIAVLGLLIHKPSAPAASS